MKKFCTLIIVLFLSIGSRADEGMWLPMFLEKLNYAEMHGMGLQLSPEEIYSINNSSLKDAIVRMGGGFCTGEIISSQGLLLTNHHCAYDYIQQHSSVEKDYLSDGFWAMNKSEEIPNEGLFVEFLVRMKDVTNEVLAEVESDMGEEERNAIVQDAIDVILKKEKEGNDYKIDVKSFFEGNEYYLFVYEVYNDVRLVGAPPESIGKYGGDTDNWMWPRHTGDFSLFRVYTAPDGSPAEYSKDNIPLKPRHHLPVSLNGVKEGDFAMIFGYPGSTDRYLTSYGVELAIEETNPTRVKIRQDRLAAMKEDMNVDKEVRLQYASKYAQVSNYWKYFIGQTKGLENLNVYNKKMAEEKAFIDWVNASPERIKKYGNPFDEIKAGYDELRPYNKAFIYAYEAGFGAEIVSYGYRFGSFLNLLNQENVDPEILADRIAGIKERSEEFFGNFNKETDKKVFKALMKLYYEDIEASLRPDFLLAVDEDPDTPDSLRYFENYVNNANGDIGALADYIYGNSIIIDQSKLNEFLDNPDAAVLASDPGFIVAQSVLSAYRGVYAKQLNARDQINRGNRLYVAGLREMYPGKNFYPNANSTMRFTYGKVLSYNPKDAIKYNHVSTLKGVMEKEDPTNPEFIVPEELKDLYKTKEFGQYEENGKLVVGFLTNTDITGGNSGSPVINANGELIGTAFDGNWEAMSGDIAFEPDLQRTISVDIRYTLFIIDKFAKASHLVDEMTLVKNDSDKKSKATKKKKKKYK